MHSPALILGEYLAIRATHEMGPVLNEIDSRPFLPGLNAHTASEGAVEQDEIHAARRGHVTAKELRDHFHLPLHTVAKKFGMCTTAFKKLCRRFGLAKWPHRQLRGIDKKIAALKTELNYSATGQNDQYLAGLSNLEMEKARLAQAPWERTSLRDRALIRPATRMRTRTQLRHQARAALTSTVTQMTLQRPILMRRRMRLCLCGIPGR